MFASSTHIRQNIPELKDVNSHIQPPQSGDSSTLDGEKSVIKPDGGRNSAKFRKLYIA